MARSGQSTRRKNKCKDKGSNPLVQGYSKEGTEERGEERLRLLLQLWEGG